MPRHLKHLYLVIFITALLMIFTACSSISLNPLNWFSRSSSFKSDLKFKISILPFEDTVGIGGEAVETNTAKLVAEQMAKSGRVVIVPWSKLETYLQTNQSSGPITQSTAILAGRAVGLNAVTLGTISELSQVTKRTGWRRWFRFITKKRDYVNAILVAKMIDVESGITLGANIGTGETMVNQTADDIWMGTKSNVMEQSTVVSTMDQAVEELSENLVESLSQASWKGFITNVSGTTATLNAGRDVGVKPGHRFAIFTVKDRLTNAAGQTYIIPGPPKAKLEAVQINEETAELKILSGEVLAGETAQAVAE